MEKRETKNEIIMIRLSLNPKEDQPLYDFFVKLKAYLGIKVNTEVTRFCIKKAYEFLFENKEK